MKRTEWRIFTDQHLRPLVGDVRAVRNLAVFPSNEWVVNALALESSDFSPTKFNLTAFVLPLYVPTRHLYFTFGDRLGALSGRPEKWWDASEPGWEQDVVSQIEEEALPFFDRVRDPHALAAYIASHLEKPMRSDPRIAEVRGYSLILGNQWSEGNSELVSALAMAVQLGEESWAQESAERMTTVISDSAKDRDRVIDQFRQWRNQNYQTLKLAA